MKHLEFAKEIYVNRGVTPKEAFELASDFVNYVETQQNTVNDIEVFFDIEHEDPLDYSAPHLSVSRVRVYCPSRPEFQEKTMIVPRMGLFAEIDRYVNAELKRMLVAQGKILGEYVIKSTKPTKD